MKTPLGPPAISTQARSTWSLTSVIGAPLCRQRILVHIAIERGNGAIDVQIRALWTWAAWCFGIAMKCDSVSRKSASTSEENNILTSSMSAAKAAPRTQTSLDLGNLKTVGGETHEEYVPIYFGQFFRAIVKQIQ